MGKIKTPGGDYFSFNAFYLLQLFSNSTFAVDLTKYIASIRF